MRMHERAGRAATLAAMANGGWQYAVTANPPPTLRNSRRCIVLFYLLTRGPRRLGPWCGTTSNSARRKDRINCDGETRQQHAGGLVAGLEVAMAAIALTAQAQHADHLFVRINDPILGNAGSCIFSDLGLPIAFAVFGAAADDFHDEVSAVPICVVSPMGVFCEHEYDIGFTEVEGAFDAQPDPDSGKQHCAGGIRSRKGIEHPNKI